MYMPRSYHIGIARFAAGANAKWIDNLLSVHRLPGVQSARQGIARKISAHGIHCIALVRQLSQDLGVSVDTGVSIAPRLLSVGADKPVRVTEHLELRLDREAFESAIDRRIEEGVESIVPARRGRPRIKR
jgi:hypothetical protein